MAQWAKLQQLQGEALKQVQNVYGDHFPLEVRFVLAQWIEDKPWSELDPDNPNHENYAARLAVSLIQELEKKASSEDLNFIMKLKLDEAAVYFRDHYSSNPQQLIKVIKNCLQAEHNAIQLAENPCVHVPNQILGISHIHQEISQHLDKLKKKTQETEEEVRRMQQEQESFVIQYQESAKRQAQIQQLTNQPNTHNNVEMLSKLQREKELLDDALRQRATSLVQQRQALADRQQDTLMQVHALQTRVLDDELIKWKRNQQLSGNGVIFENNLDQIQEWCELLVEIIWQNRQQIKRVEMLCSQLPINSPMGNILERFRSLNSDITGLLSSLVTSTFVIEKLPPQVMKTNTRFTATVRLLVGGKLNVHMTPPQVRVTIISEAQANSLLKNKVGMTEASGEILNNTGTMEYHQATRQLSVSFRNMQLRKIKRAEKKGTESVMDEKFSLLFQSEFKVGGEELVFRVWTLSLPVVVIVHGNQEPHAWATVTWDNAFAEPVYIPPRMSDSYQGRVPFAVPDKVPWPQMAEVLNMKFHAACGQGLSAENLQYLATKGFRNSQIQDFSNMMITWSQFCKEPLPDRNFTFWEWFYAIMKVTREHLRVLWNDGVVIGFIGRRNAEEMLLKRPSGTFLLRFSDSELGGVTIAWVAEDPQQETHEVFMLQPFTSRDFSIRTLADRINDLKHLLYLYPDRAKDQAFGKYYTPFTENQPPSSNGYVKPVLVTHIPGLTGMVSGLDSFPGTPQSYFPPHSPDTGGYIDPSSMPGSGDQPMHAGAAVSDMDYDLLGMDLMSGDMDVPVDFSTINVSDLVAYTKSE
ncbi:signal transducer and activator of transcription 5B-like isoform X1 [Limulus polyphemus]|uniref:Signal transducer and activator of transcription n=1 Tax=Limulus polyphemus TaxID=6850 RepID=A0ABM1BC34_LIMPO|nr:signal transducer and activator of transcription 5B-like isoform X1 [Limulus polyphemus]